MMRGSTKIQLFLHQSTIIYKDLFSPFVIVKGPSKVTFFFNTYHIF